MANNKDESPYITTGERIRSFIGWAFVISIAVHFIVLPLFPRLNQHHEDQTVEKVSVTKKIIVKVPTPPPPTPTPPPPKQTPPPKKQVQVPQPKLKIQPPKTTSSNSGPSQPKYVPPKTGTENGVPAGQGTAPPVQTAATPGPPASTPKPSCQTPYQDATVNQESAPDYPDSARQLGLGQVQVAIQVTIGPDGSLVSESVAQSAGNMALDQAALSAAKQSTYLPKIVDCKPVTGTYLFKVNFDPNS